MKGSCLKYRSDVLSKGANQIVSNWGILAKALTAYPFSPSLKRDGNDLYIFNLFIAIGFSQQVNLKGTAMICVFFIYSLSLASANG